MKSMEISVDSFHRGEPIPREYSRNGGNVSPEVSWQNVPEGAKSIALVLDDPDANHFTHWVIFNVPPDKGGLPRDVPKQQRLADGSKQGLNSDRTFGYSGPHPPPGRPHHYYFRVYALDALLDLTGSENRSIIEKAMEGHVLAQGEVMGTFGQGR